MASALALVTALAYGCANYLGPRLARTAPTLLVLVAGQAVSIVLALVLVGVTGDDLPPGGQLGLALLAGLGNAGGLLLFFAAAAAGPLSVVGPVGALGAAVPVAAGLASGDAFTAQEGAGIALAVAGLVLVTAGRSDHRPSAVGAPAVELEHEAAGHGRAVLLAVASAVSFGCFLALMAPASADSAPWAVLISRVSLLGLLVAAALRAGALRGATLRGVAPLSLSGLLLFTGTVSYAVATREGDLSVVSVLGSLHPVVTVGLALSLDRDRLSRAQGAGVVAVLVGVVLLSAR